MLHFLKKSLGIIFHLSLLTEALCPPVYMHEHVFKYEGAHHTEPLLVKKRQKYRGGKIFVRPQSSFISVYSVQYVQTKRIVLTNKYCCNISLHMIPYNNTCPTVKFRHSPIFLRNIFAACIKVCWYISRKTKIRKTHAEVHLQKFYYHPEMYYFFSANFRDIPV